MKAGERQDKGMPFTLQPLVVFHPFPITCQQSQGQARFLVEQPEFLGINDGKRQGGARFQRRKNIVQILGVAGLQPFTFDPDAGRPHPAVTVIGAQMPGHTVEGMRCDLTHFDDLDDAAIGIDTAQGVITGIHGEKNGDGRHKRNGLRPSSLSDFGRR